MKFCWLCTFLTVLAVSCKVKAQHANDAPLFSIALSEDSTSIYGCLWNDQVSSSLAGPVLMARNALLFYSRNGYVLYNTHGKIQDSHSLIKANKKAIHSGESPLRLAYPLDSVTILYYRESSGRSRPPEVFQKKLFKRDMKKVNGNAYAFFQQISSERLFNLASNSITDEMGRKAFLIPQLVGYTAIENGKKWWAIEKFYSFSSPLILEQNGKYLSFFPGLKSDQECEFKKHLIEPLGVFSSDGRWFYYGLYSSLGNQDDEYYQTLALCDQAGNLIYTNKLLKQEITDAVLQKVESSNTIFTVRRAARHVFVPAVDDKGIIYYGMIDFERRKIDCFERSFYRFASESCGPEQTELFTAEDEFAYSPLILDCTPSSKRGVISEVTRLTDAGIETLNRDDQTRSGFFVLVHRLVDPDLQKKLSRTQYSLPPAVQAIQDSLRRVETSWCPYSISLNHDEKGKLGSLHYGLGDEIVCARVLAVTNTFEVYIRVDLVGWAEVLAYTIDGKYLNRFVFNRQDYNSRKDLIVVSEDRDIIEKDYESSKNGHRFLRWSLSAAENSDKSRKKK